MRMAYGQWGERRGGTCLALSCVNLCIRVIRYKNVTVLYRLHYLNRLDRTPGGTELRYTAHTSDRARRTAHAPHRTYCTRTYTQRGVQVREAT